MAHIVCVTSGLAGLLHASLEMVTRLARDGHRVTYACTLDAAIQVRAHGVEYEQLLPVAMDPAPQVESIGGPLARPRKKWRELRTARDRRGLGVEALGTEAFTELLARLAPDLLLIDFELYEHVFAAAAAGVPFGLLSPFFTFEKRPGLPPLDTSLVPGQGLRGSRLGTEFAWLRTRAARSWSRYKVWLRYFGTDRRGVLLEYARRSGFPEQTLRQLDWVSLFTYAGLPLLQLTARELDFPHEPSPGAQFVGPMVHAARREAQVDAALEARVESVCRTAKQSGRRLLHCSFSSMAGSDREFLARIMDAVAARPDWSLVAGLGGAAKDDLPSDVPSNVHVYPWLPQLNVLAHADASIHHGGINTIHECVHHGVPMLVYSGGRFDQNGNAARVAHHGLGFAAERGQETAASIGTRLERLLADDSIRSATAEMGAIFASYERERRLENAVAKLLERSRKEPFSAASV